MHIPLVGIVSETCCQLQQSSSDIKARVSGYCLDCGVEFNCEGRFWSNSFSDYETGYTKYMYLMVPLGIMSNSGIPLGTHCFGAHSCCLLILFLVFG